MCVYSKYMLMPKRVFDPLQMVVSRLMLVLGTELRSSMQEQFNIWAIFPDPLFLSLSVSSSTAVALFDFLSIGGETDIRTNDISYD